MADALQSNVFIVVYNSIFLGDFMLIIHIHGTVLKSKQFKQTLTREWILQNKELVYFQMKYRIYANAKKENWQLLKFPQFKVYTAQTYYLPLATLLFM